jgi:oligopeptide/dipeptide ABC transporter ATP-binding protein
MALLEAQHLTMHYALKRGVVARLLGLERRRMIKAVEAISFAVERGEILGIVGESGCGKSTTCALLARLAEPSGGRILFEGDDIAALRGAALRRFRARVQMIFQDPFDSLNPRFRVADLVAEGPRALRLWDAAETQRRVEAMLARVGLPPERHAGRYPHELSGGERQRVGIAAALVVQPRLVIADEPLSMLDVSIRASILDLLRELARELDFACVYVSHDLSILTNICDRVIVMYLGQIVETGTARDIVENPRHPYTRALVAAIPVPDPRHRRPPIEISGELAQPIDPPPGCRFAPRCPRVVDACRREFPAETRIAARHVAFCHRLESRG